MSVRVHATIERDQPEIKYRKSAKIVSILDILSGLVTLGFHAFTLLTQELAESPIIQIPLSPAGLGLFGYIMVMAWIGIVIVNIIQINVAMSLYRGSSYESEATKSLRSCRTWFKTAIFLLTLLVTKLVICGFLIALGTPVPLSAVFGVLEFLSRLAGVVIVKRFLHELTVVFPEISRMYFEAQAIEPENKRDLVGEAVWC